MPQDAEPGGHYAGILVGRFSPEALEGSGTAAVTVGSVAASLVLVAVSGEVIEEGSIVEFRADKGVYEHFPVDFFIRFENTGNVHVKPQGTIEIYEGSNKVYELQVNKASGNVLPNSIRQFDATWSEGKTFGKYRAVVTLDYGTEDKTVTAELTFWVIPWKMIAGIAGGVIAVIVGLLLLLRRFRIRFRFERKGD